MSVAAYLLVGEAPDPELAARIAARYKSCPHVHFIASFGTMLVGVWYVPEAKRWWLEFVAEHPQIALGLTRAALYRTEHPGYPEEMPTRPARSEGPLAPCGSDCRACDRASRTAVRGVSDRTSSATARSVSDQTSAIDKNGACEGCPAFAE